MEITYFIYLFVNWWTFGLFPPFGYYKLYCYQIYVHMFLFLEYISRRGIVGAHGNSMLNLLRNFQTFPKRFYHLTFLPVKHTGSPFLRSYEHMFLSVFFIIAIVWSVKQHGITLQLSLIHISFSKKCPQVITNDHTNCARQVTHACWSLQLSTLWNNWFK